MVMCGVWYFVMGCDVRIWKGILGERLEDVVRSSTFVPESDVYALALSATTFAVLNNYPCP
jgi:hypothetical protein